MDDMAGERFLIIMVHLFVVCLLGLIFFCITDIICGLFCWAMNKFCCKYPFFFVEDPNSHKPSLWCSDFKAKDRNNYNMIFCSREIPDTKSNEQEEEEVKYKLLEEGEPHNG